MFRGWELKERERKETCPLHICIISHNNCSYTHTYLHSNTETANDKHIHASPPQIAKRFSAKFRYSPFHHLLVKYTRTDKTLVIHTHTHSNYFISHLSFSRYQKQKHGKVCVYNIGSFWKTQFEKKRDDQTKKTKWSV